MDKQVFLALVDKELAILEKELIQDTYSPVDLLNEVSKHLVQAGGKRLRPALCLICAKNGLFDIKAVLPIAVAIELTHMATLVHDDVIDEAAIRRGAVTANRQWGNHAAVLAGDYLFAKAFSILADTEHSSSMRIYKILAAAIHGMCEGELMQFCDCFNPDQTVDNYFRRIARKTADFIAASCELGAVAASHLTAEAIVFKNYGYALGMAFQITDDILDVTSSSLNLGKPAGHDLRQGIITLPIIFALNDSKHRQELRDLIAKGKLTEEQINRCLEIVNNSNAVKQAYKTAEGFLEEAKTLTSSLKPEVRGALIAVADFIGDRHY